MTSTLDESLPFEVVGPLGRGGAARVLEVRLPDTPGRFAAKLLEAHDARALERFRREGETLATLRHPGIVAARRSGVGPDGVPFIVFDLVAGPTLRDVLDARERIAPDRVVTLGRELAAALSAAHGAGIVHRDVKPENVLIDANGRVRLADFGLALARDRERLTATGQLAGTFPYMAPEQLDEDGELGPAADVHAVGVLLWEALAGERPFPAPAGPALWAQIRSFTPPSIRETIPEVDQVLARAIGRCLAKDPAARFEDAGALLQALEAAPAAPRLLERDELVALGPPAPDDVPDAEALARAPTAGTRIGPYTILEELGRGGAGVVYRGRHEELGRDVALKMLLAGALANATARERLRLEARAMAPLRHRHIVAVHDVGEDHGRAYLVSDLVVGPSLATRLDRDGPLPPREAAAIVAKVADALHAAHETLVLHRDVKPGNILLDADGEPLVTDFGLAKRVSTLGETDPTATAIEGPTATGEMLGTPHFMAPEQVRGDANDARVDVYGLGATLYALLTGAPPFAARSGVALLHAVLERPPRSPRDARPELPRDLCVICLRCLEKEPADRYPSAHALAADLGRFLEDRPIHARPPSPLERAIRSARRHRRLVAAALLGVLALAAVAIAVAWSVRRGVVEDARVTAIVARAALRARGEGGSGDEQLALALAALSAAQRWADLAPSSPDARRARFDAACALGEVALAQEQWAFARQAFRQAEATGLDGVAVAAHLERVDDARDAETRARRDAVLDVLDRAESGQLAGASEGLGDAVFTLAGYPDARTVAILAERLDAITTALLETERIVYLDAIEPNALERRHGAGRLDALPAALEARAALRPGEDLAAEHANALRAAALRIRRRRAAAAKAAVAVPPIREIVAERQGRALGTRLDAARIAAEALGRIGIAEGAVEPLGRYLFADADERRAEVAAKALVRLETPRAAEIVQQARARLGLMSDFSERVGRFLDARGGLALPAGDDDRPGTWLLRGEVRYAQGDARGAAVDFGRAIELDPRNALAWSNRCNARRAAGDLEGAIADGDRAIELDGRLTVAWTNRSLARAQSGDLEGAIADATAAIAIDPDFAQGFTNRGTARMDSGDLAGAIADLGRAIELEPERAAHFSNRSVARRRTGDTAGALADATAAIDRDPSLAEAWCNRAAALRARGEARAAIADLDRAVELRPAWAVPRFLRGAAREEANDLDGAAADYDAAIERDADYEQAWASRGALRGLRGDPEGAIADLDRAVELDPQSARYREQRGAARRDAGDIDGALRDYDAAIARDAGWVRAWNGRGATRMRQNDWAAAIADFTRALKIDPSQAAVAFNRGVAHFNAGDLDAAIADLGEAFEIDGRFVLALLRRADAHMQKGDRGSARRDLEAFLEKAPAHHPKRLEAEGKLAKLSAGS